MGHHQLAAVENVVAYQAVEEIGRLPAERISNVLGQGLHFGQGLRQAVLDLHVLASELPHQLHVVVAGHAESRPVGHHVADQTQGLDDPRATVHQIAEKDGLAPSGCRNDRLPHTGLSACSTGA